MLLGDGLVSSSLIAANADSIGSSGDLQPSAQQSNTIQLEPIYAQFRDQTRFWIQRVAVPCLMVVGLFGNLITIVIMTRRRMRSTTNMYLAALAFVDMLYLVLTFLLGLSHYPNMAERRYYLYWQLRPFLMMLTDACSNTSVWLTVTFTIERFIAVKYPIKGKVWCTEARAKRLIVCVFLVGVLFASPVPFEWKVIEKRTTVDGGLKSSEQQVVVLPPQTTTTTTTTPITTTTSSTLGSSAPGSALLLGPAGEDDGDLDEDRDLWEDLRELENQQQQQRKSLRGGELQKVATANEFGAKKQPPPLKNEEQVKFVLTLENSDFGLNETYKTIYYWSTAVIFYFIPLLSLTFFNGFLIHSVHSSRRKRNLMTSMGQQQQQQQHSAQLQQHSKSTLGQHCDHDDKAQGRAKLLLLRRNTTKARHEQPHKLHQLPECKSTQEIAAASANANAAPAAYDNSSGTLSVLNNQVMSKLSCQDGGGGSLEVANIPTPGREVATNSPGDHNDDEETSSARRPRNSIIKSTGTAAAIPSSGEVASAAAPLTTATATCKVTFQQERANSLARSRCDTSDDATSHDAENYQQHPESGTCDTSNTTRQPGRPVMAVTNIICQTRQAFCGGGGGVAAPNAFNNNENGEVARKPGVAAARLDSNGDNKVVVLENPCQAGRPVVASHVKLLRKSSSAFQLVTEGQNIPSNSNPNNLSNQNNNNNNNNTSRLHQINSQANALRGGVGGGSCKGAGLFGSRQSHLNKNSLIYTSNNGGGSWLNDNGSCATHQQATAQTGTTVGSNSSASSQERRITIMLIAVVILFLFCQIPSAGMLIYTAIHETTPNTNEHALLLAFGNIFNFLMAVNAAGNFILYSFLSKKYRRTFVILFCKCFNSGRGGGTGPGGAKQQQQKQLTGATTSQASFSHHNHQHHHSQSEAQCQHQRAQHKHRQSTTTTAAGTSPPAHQVVSHQSTTTTTTSSAGLADETTAPPERLAGGGGGGGNSRLIVRICKSVGLPSSTKCPPPASCAPEQHKQQQQPQNDRDLGANLGNDDPSSGFVLMPPVEHKRRRDTLV